MQKSRLWYLDSSLSPTGAALVAGRTMTALSFPWLFIGFAAIVDVVGLFYLWRRRQSAAGTHHSIPARTARRFPAERRRMERRGTARGTPLAQA